MPYLGIFGLEFKKNITRFEISIFEFVYLQNFEKKQKCVNFGRKMSYLGIFGLDFENNTVIFESSTVESV